MQSHDLPRERLYRNGASALSEVELLSVLIGTGTKDFPVQEVAKMVLNSLPLPKLAHSSPGQLCQFPGISRAKGSLIVAAFELCRRLQDYRFGKRARIRGAEDVVNLVRPEIGLSAREHFLGVYLDARNGILCKRTIAIGSLNASLVHPREIFKVAFQESAAALVLIHNHPSGDPAPSDEDILITKNLVKAGDLLGIEVLDHIIVTHSDYYSFAEHQEES